MKTSILAARDHTAQTRIVAAMEALAERWDIEVPGQLRRQVGSPAERAMQQREGIADLLEAIVVNVEQLEQVAEAASMPLETAVFLVREADEDWLEAAKAATPEMVEETLQAIDLVNAVSLIREASDKELLALEGVGKATLAAIRELVAVVDPGADAPETSVEETGEAEEASEPEATESVLEDPGDAGEAPGEGEIPEEGAGEEAQEEPEDVDEHNPGDVAGTSEAA